MMFRFRKTKASFALMLLLAMVLSLPFRLAACDGAGNCDIVNAEAKAAGCCAPSDDSSSCPVHQSDTRDKCCFIDVGFVAEAVVSTARDVVNIEVIETTTHPPVISGFDPSPSLLIATAPRGSPRDDTHNLPDSSSRLHLHWCVLLR